MDILLCRADSSIHCQWHACLAIGHIAEFSSQALMEKFAF